MQKKNVKGYIALFLGLASIVLILVACFVPMTKLTGFGLGGKVSFYGTANVIMIVGAIVCAIAAIVLGAMSQKDADKKGPRKSGVVIGILCTIIGILASLIIGLFSTMTEFINNEGQSGVIADLIKDNKDVKKAMDDAIKALQKGADVEETGLPGYNESEESSSAASEGSSDKTEASTNSAG